MAVTAVLAESQPPKVVVEQTAITKGMNGYDAAVVVRNESGRSFTYVTFNCAAYVNGKVVDVAPAIIGALAAGARGFDKVIGIKSDAPPDKIECSLTQAY